jgi:hypothetical protein
VVTKLQKSFLVPGCFTQIGELKIDSSKSFDDNLHGWELNFLGMFWFLDYIADKQPQLLGTHRDLKNIYQSGN